MHFFSPCSLKKRSYLLIAAPGSRLLQRGGLWWYLLATLHCTSISVNKVWVASHPFSMCILCTGNHSGSVYAAVAQLCHFWYLKLFFHLYNVSEFTMKWYKGSRLTKFYCLQHILVQFFEDALVLFYITNHNCHLLKKKKGRIPHLQLQTFHC